MRAPTSSVSVLRAILASLDAHGVVDTAACLAEAGIAPEIVDQDGARVPFERLQRAWEVAARRAGDAAFGLHLAERAQRGTFDLIDHTTRSCGTLREAFERLARYQRLLHDAVAVDVVERDDEAWVVHRVAAPAVVTRHAAEAAVAAWLLRARAIADPDLTARRVTFRHPAPRDVSEHERVFRCPVSFEAGETVLALPRSAMSLPVKTADPGLRAVLDRHAELVLARLPSLGDLSPLRAALTEAMRAGTVDLATVARRLGTSRRSLQRRLSEEGTRFEQVLDDLRRELALRYLGDPALGLHEIAFLLGYSQPSAFHRAFRRWTGTTPQAHRKRLPS